MQTDNIFDWKSCHYSSNIHRGDYCDYGDIKYILWNLSSTFIYQISWLIIVQYNKNYWRKLASIEIRIWKRQHRCEICKAGQWW